MDVVKKRAITSHILKSLKTQSEAIHAIELCGWDDFPEALSNYSAMDAILYMIWGIPESDMPDICSGDDIDKYFSREYWDYAVDYFIEGRKTEAEVIDVFENWAFT